MLRKHIDKTNRSHKLKIARHRIDISENRIPHVKERLMREQIKDKGIKR